jgi:hypothetical protein
VARNWPCHTIRIDDELWDRFGRGVEAIRVKNPELGGRRAVVRELIRAEQRMALFAFDQRMADRAEQDRLREDLGG